MSSADGFFAIDRRAWARVCDIGLNAAVSYLVLARGTGRDNRTTAWSDNAVRKYAGLGRIRTDKAMAGLIASGVVRQDECGGRPRYSLRPPHEVPGCEGHMPMLSDAERLAFDRLAEIQPGETVEFSAYAPGKHSYAAASSGNDSPYSAALGLVEKGLARAHKGGRFEPIPFDAAKAAEPDWTWLPNTIVDGAADETPPVQLLRQAQNPAALRLFADLYHAHGLVDDGGIHWRRMRQSYTRHKVGQRGPFVVWGFQAGQTTAWTSVPFVASHLTGKYTEVQAADGSKTRRDTGLDSFWGAEGLLVELGLLEFVGHVIEADNDEAELIHPYALGNGEPHERDIAASAHEAAETLLTPRQVEWATANAMRLLPMRAHFSDVQMVGIGRLRYRPQTKATAAWAAKRGDWADWAERYRELASEGDRQHQGNIKEPSMVNQRTY